MRWVWYNAQTVPPKSDHNQYDQYSQCDGGMVKFSGGLNNPAMKLRENRDDIVTE